MCGYSHPTRRVKRTPCATRVSLFALSGTSLALIWVAGDLFCGRYASYKQDSFQCALLIATFIKVSEFTTGEDEIPIDAVKEYSHLYNNTLKEYRDHNRAEQSWQAIAEKIGTTWSDRLTWKQVKIGGYFIFFYSTSRKYVWECVNKQCSSKYETSILIRCGQILISSEDLQAK